MDLSDMYEALRELARRNQRPIIWELRRIVTAALEAEGLWPWPPAQS
jgi:hypothetical protein